MNKQYSCAFLLISAHQKVTPRLTLVGSYAVQGTVRPFASSAVWLDIDGQGIFSPWAMRVSDTPKDQHTGRHASLGT